MTSDEIAGLLKAKHPNCICVEELRISSGASRGSGQRIDLWAMEEWPSKGFKRVAYEVKISRGDYLREIRDPLKRRGAKLVAQEFYFVAPDGVIKPEEVPYDCGLIVVRDGELVIEVDAPQLPDSAPTWGFVVSLVRSARGLGGGR